MNNFAWPEYILFDDTAADINRARVVWIEQRAKLPDGGTIADFLEFMSAYATEMDKRRTRYMDSRVSA